MIWRGVQVKPYRNSAEKDTVQVGFQYYYHIQADQELTDDLEEACKLNSTKNKQTKTKQCRTSSVAGDISTTPS